MRFGSSQYKDHIFRRLLQRLEQCIERSDGEHMDLIDNVYFKAALRRPVCNFFPYLADIVHTVVGSGVDLYHVHGSP